MTGGAANSAPVVRGGRRMGLSLALSGALLVALVLVSGLTPRGIWAAIQTVPVWAYLPIAAVQSAIIVLGAVKWRAILAASGSRVGLRDATAATAIGALAGQVMPIQIATPAARAWIARRHDIPLGRALGTSLMEQAFEVLVLAGVALIGAALVLGATGAVAAAALGLTAAGGLLLLRGPLGRAIRAIRPGPGPVGAAVSALARGLAEAADLSRRVFLALIGLSFARYALLAGMNVAILGVLAPQASPVALFAAYPLVLFLMSLPFFPGGLGVAELTWAGVLVAQGETAAAAAEAALALRIVMLFGFVLVAPVLIALRDRVWEGGG